MRAAAGFLLAFRCGHGGPLSIRVPGPCVGACVLTVLDRRRRMSLEEGFLVGRPGPLRSFFWAACEAIDMLYPRKKAS